MTALLETAVEGNRVPAMTRTRLFVHSTFPIMPNWCQNQLTVTGATPEFRAWLADYGFSFEKISPLPKPRKSGKADRHGLSGLKLCLSAWGAKWDLGESEQLQAARELLQYGSAFFDTAWSPPIKAIEALSRKFPAVTFQLDYCELGMFFAGTATFIGGACHDDCHGEKPAVMKIACDIFGQEDEEACDLAS